MCVCMCVCACVCACQLLRFESIVFETRFHGERSMSWAVGCVAVTEGQRDDGAQCDLPSGGFGVVLV